MSRKDRNIKITDKEWEAIQAGAISNQKLKEILSNSDPDILREKAMPKQTRSLPDWKINAMVSMAKSGNYTLAEIADRYGISQSTLSKYLKGGNK